MGHPFSCRGRVFHGSGWWRGSPLSILGTMASVGAAKKAAVKGRPKKAASAKVTSAKATPAKATAAKGRGSKKLSAKTAKGKGVKAKSGRGRKAVQELLELEAEVCEWVCGWDFENEAWAEGSRWVAGVDEVGRGPLFGPVVAAAV